MAHSIWGSRDGPEWTSLTTVVGNDFIAPSVEGWWIDEVARTHDMLEADKGENLGFTRIVATKI